MARAQSGQYANADSDVIAILFAVGHVGIGTDLQFAVNGSVLVDQESHGVGGTLLLELLAGSGGVRRIDGECEGIPAQRSDGAGDGLRGVILLRGGSWFGGVISFWAKVGQATARKAIRAKLQMPVMIFLFMR